jgi:antiviral helicase SKI2
MLSMLPKLDCDICLQDIDEFYDLTTGIIEQHQKLVSMAAAHPQGNKLLASGRVVVLRDGVCD